MLILSLLDRWIFGDSAFILGRASEKEKTRASTCLKRKQIFFENLIFYHCYESHCYFKKWYPLQKLSKYFGYEIIFTLKLEMAK